MQAESSTMLFPATPSHYAPYPGLAHQPLTSSPLASPKSSPVAAAQARRRSQYKSRTPTMPMATSSSASATAGEDPQKAFLRDRFKARCLERARNARQKEVTGRRSSAYDSSSDGFDVDMDGEEDQDDEDVMQDELFRRIMENANRKSTHSYRLSYANEVGSSVDPDMEDIERWESELRQPSHSQEPPTLAPEDLENEELATYAEEYAAIADFEEFDVDDLWPPSDVESEPEVSTQRNEGNGKGKARDMGDVSMDVTG